MDQGAALLPQPGQGLRDADDVPGEGATIAIRYPRLVRQGRSRDAAIQSVWQQPRQDGDQVERVADALLVAPVGCVDIGFDRGAMERPMRKSVDQCDIQSALVEKATELVEPIVLEQLARVARGQAEPDAEGGGR